MVMLVYPILAIASIAIASAGHPNDIISTSGSSGDDIYQHQYTKSYYGTDSDYDNYQQHSAPSYDNQDKFSFAPYGKDSSASDSDSDSTLDEDSQSSSSSLDSYESERIGKVHNGKHSDSGSSASSESDLGDLSSLLEGLGGGGGLGDLFGNGKPEEKKDVAKLKFGTVFGGHYGSPYNDDYVISLGQHISSIVIRAGDRVDAIQYTIESQDGNTTTVWHGSDGGTGQKFDLSDGESITAIKTNMGKKHGRTRIFYIEFTTSLNATFSGGTHTDDVGSETAPDGYVLGGFVGSCDDNLDSVGAIWLKLDKK